MYVLLMYAFASLRLKPIFRIMNNAAKFVKNNPNNTTHVSYFLMKFNDLFTWTDSEEMLDVGCATGVSTYEVLYPFAEKRMKHLIGSDISQEAISIGNEIYKKPNLSFVRMDISDVKVGEEYRDRFGHIFAFNCLHVVRPTEAWVWNVYKMLKNNGQMFATIVLTPNYYTKVMLAQKSEKNSRWKKYFEECPDLFVDYGPNPIQAISESLQNRGFAIDAIAVEPMKFVFPDLDTLRGLWYGASNIVKVLPPEMKADYFEDFAEKALKLFTQDGNSYFCIVNIMTVLATKQESM